MQDTNLTELKIEILSGPLSLELTPYVLDGNDAKISEVLYRADIEVFGIISSLEISRYLFLRDMLEIINDMGNSTRKKVSTALKVFSEFDMSNQLDNNKFMELADLLIADTALGFTENDKQILISLSKKKISRAEQIGLNCSIQNIAQALRGGL